MSAVPGWGEGRLAPGSVSWWVMPYLALPAQGKPAGGDRRGDVRPFCTSSARKYPVIEPGTRGWLVVRGDTVHLAVETLGDLLFLRPVLSVNGIRDTHPDTQHVREGSQPG